MTRERLRREMSVSEFEQWVAYYLVSPFDDERGDTNLALLRQTLIAINTPKDKRVPTLSELMPYAARTAAPTIDSFVSALLAKPTD